MHIPGFFNCSNKANMFYRGYTKKYWKEIPIPVAWIIGLINYRKLRPNGFLKLNTYDASGQSTHPDIVFWHQEYWMVCSPYPYACGKYENPCVYHGKTLNNLKPISAAMPLARPTGKTKRDYCSDPALLVFRKQLYVFWRDSWHNTDGTITERLCFCVSNDGLRWSTKFFAMENNYSNDLGLQLSPALLCIEDEIVYRLYVEKVRPSGGDIYISSSNDCISWTKPLYMEVTGLPEGYDLWHIGIASKRYNKVIENDTDSLNALFLLRCKEDQNKYDLYYAKGSITSKNWHITVRAMDDKLIKASVQPYKSAFIPTCGKILYGTVDKNNRWYLYISREL